LFLRRLLFPSSHARSSLCFSCVPVLRCFLACLWLWYWFVDSCLVFFFIRFTVGVSCLGKCLWWKYKSFTFSAVGNSSMICYLMAFKSSNFYKLLPLFVSSGTSQRKTLLCAFETSKGHVWCSHHDNDPYCYGVHHIQLLVAWILAQHPGVSVSTSCIKLIRLPLPQYSFHKIVLKK
jgi:hypothetical protein